MAANTGWIYAAIGGTTCVSTRQSAHTVAAARIEFERCKFIDTLGQCVLNLSLADSRIGGIADQSPPYQLSCPANSDYPPMIGQRIADQPYWILLRREPRTRADQG